MDLLVVMETDGDKKERYRAVSELLYPRQFPVDIIVKTPTEIEDALRGGKDNSFFIREIIKKGSADRSRPILR